MLVLRRFSTAIKTRLGFSGDPQKPKPFPDESKHIATRFDELPIDIILCVCDFLQRDSQVLLSMSCKSMFRALNQTSKVHIDDLETRVRFLRSLEWDHPRFVTCRTCGFLYVWSNAPRRQYGCPRQVYHLCRNMDVYAMQLGTIVRREHVDLISRYYQWGPQYGLPVSSLDKRCTLRYKIRREDEGRWISGTVMVRSKWTIIPEPEADLTLVLRNVQCSFCLHSYSNVVSNRWISLEQRVMNLHTDVEPRATKCPFCAFDSKIFLGPKVHHTRSIVIMGWYDLGNRDAPRLETDQVFLLRQSATPLDRKALTSRNLQAKFEAGDIPFNMAPRVLDVA